MRFSVRDWGEGLCLLWDTKATFKKETLDRYGEREEIEQ